MSPSRVGLAGHLRASLTVVLTMVLWLVAACAGATAQVRGDEEPTGVSYSLELRKTPTPSVVISLSLVADTSLLVVGCDDWANVKHCEHEVADVRAQDAQGRDLPVTSSSNRWSIESKRGERVTIVYRLAPSKADAMADEETRYYPVLTDRYMHFVGHVALLRPQGSEATERKIHLTWRGFREAGWTVASPFGVGGDVSVRRSLEAFVHAVFVAGDYRILRARAHSGGEIIVAARPDAWPFGAEDLLATALPVIEEERRIVGVQEPSPLLITATPLTVPGPHVDGSMLTDSIALFLPSPGIVFPAPLLSLLLAHEYFHQWDINVLRPAESEGEGVAWFVEGFAEFYMRRAAFRAGRISRNDYFWHLNQALSDYAHNPMANATNERIRSEFWKSSDLNRLPYQRGQLVALILDAHLRGVTGGNSNLDAFVGHLVERARGSNQPVTSESILKAIGDAAGPDLEARIRAIVLDGRSATVPTDALAPCADLVQVPRQSGTSSDPLFVPQFEVLDRMACLGIL